jgi:endo-alpha-1,4-polygalactosaminidase (GH114 family)
MLLNKEAILNAQDLQHEDVFVEEWKGTVRVRALTGAERDAFEASIVEGKGKNVKTNLKNIRAKLVALAVINENGERLFNDHEAQVLGTKSASALDKVFEVAQRLSGLRDEDVEELAKNSESDQSEDSISA